MRLNRPERRNALSPAVMEELAQAIGDLDADEGVRCIVIAGTDEVFAAGADIKAMVGALLPGGARGLDDAVLAAGGGLPHAADRRRSPASRSAAAASWRCCAT